MIVYKITNRADGKAYVGITTRSLRTRFSQHLRDAANGSHFPLHCALRKHGAQSFAVETVATCATMDELNAAEREYIARYATGAPHGYNATLGGRGFAGRRLSQAERERKSEQLKRIHANDPTIRERISDSLKKRYRDEPSRLRGRKLSAETIAKLSALATARYADPVERAKTAAAVTPSRRRPRTARQHAHAVRVSNDPAVRERQRESFRKTRSDPQKREAWLAKLRDRQLAAWARRRAQNSPDAKGG